MSRPLRLLVAVATLAAALLCGLFGATAATAASNNTAATAPSTGAASAGAPVATSLRQLTPVFAEPKGPTGPSTPAPTGDGPDFTVKVGNKPSTSLNILLLVTLLSVAPSLLLLVTSFTKIFIVLSM